MHVGSSMLWWYISLCLIPFQQKWLSSFFNCFPTMNWGTNSIPTLLIQLNMFFLFCLGEINARGLLWSQQLYKSLDNSSLKVVIEGCCFICKRFISFFSELEAGGGGARILVEILPVSLYVWFYNLLLLIQMVHTLEYVHKVLGPISIS